MCATPEVVAIDVTTSKRASQGPGNSPFFTAISDVMLRAKRARLEPEDLRSPGGLRPRGARRPLVVALSDLEVDAFEDGAVWIRFSLPVGSFATVVLAAIGTTRWCTWLNVLCTDRGRTGPSAAAGAEV